MKMLLILLFLGALSGCAVKKGTDGKMHYVEDNPIEEAVELGLKQVLHLDVDLSPSSAEKRTIMGVDTTHFFDTTKKEEHTEVKVTTK